MSSLSSIGRDDRRRHAEPSTSSATKNSERREAAAASRLRMQRPRQAAAPAAHGEQQASPRPRRPGRRASDGRRWLASASAAQSTRSRGHCTSVARPDAKLWIGGETWRNSPSVEAASRPPWAPSPRPVAAAATRRSASSTTSAACSSGAHQRPHRLDEDVDPAARLRQLLQPALAQQQRLRAHRQPVRLIEIRRHDQVDRPELVLEQQEHDPLRRARPLARDDQPAEPHRRVVRKPLRGRRSRPSPARSVGRSSCIGCGPSVSPVVA